MPRFSFFQILCLISVDYNVYTKFKHIGKLFDKLLKKQLKFPWLISNSDKPNIRNMYVSLIKHKHVG